jgi:hypothetical protein
LTSLAVEGDEEFHTVGRNCLSVQNCVANSG